MTQLSRADNAAASCLPSVAASTAAPSAATRDTVARRARCLVEDAPGRKIPADGVAMDLRTDAIGRGGVVISFTARWWSVAEGKSNDGADTFFTFSFVIDRENFGGFKTQGNMMGGWLGTFI